MYDGVEWALGGPPPLLMAAILAVIAFWMRGAARGCARLRRLRADRLGRAVGRGHAVAVAGASSSAAVALVTRGAAGHLGGPRGAPSALIVRPVLDVMQTLPAFVYLIPGDHLLQPRHGPRRHRHHRLRDAGRRADDRAGHPAGRPRTGRGRRGVRHPAERHPAAGAAAAGAADHHGGRQPGHHAGAVDGRHRRHGRRGGPRRRRSSARSARSTSASASRAASRWSCSPSTWTGSPARWATRSRRWAAGRWPRCAPPRSRLRRAALPAAPCRRRRRASSILALVAGGMGVFDGSGSGATTAAGGGERRQGQVGADRLLQLGRVRRLGVPVEGRCWSSAATRPTSARTTRARPSPAWPPARSTT